MNTSPEPADGHNPQQPLDDDESRLLDAQAWALVALFSHATGLPVPAVTPAEPLASNGKALDATRN